MELFLGTTRVTLDGTIWETHPLLVTFPNDEMARAEQAEVNRAIALGPPRR
jgi:hypothetical protein